MSKFDDWVFYRRQFSRMWNGIKSIDLLAVDPDKTAWFIEVKDYSEHARTKPSDLSGEVARKVFDTLAAMLAAKLNANDAEEVKMAAAVLGAKKLRVVLHLEQPRKHSAFRPRAIDLVAVKQELQRLLKPIDPHADVVETNRMGTLAWSVK
ncbi:MAG: hypothetical protein ACMG6S_05625 [Byssovorax sp.]